MFNSVNVSVYSFRLPLSFLSEGTPSIAGHPDSHDFGMWGNIPSLEAGLYKAGVN